MMTRSRLREMIVIQSHCINIPWTNLMDKTNQSERLYSYHFSFHELSITRPRLEFLMGYEHGAIPESISRILKETLDRTPDYCAIQGGFVIKDTISFDNIARLITVDNVTFNPGDIVYSQVKKAEIVAIFACTAGPGISDWSKKLMAEGDPAAGYIVDILGSEIVETAMDKMHMLLSGIMTASGFKISNRYSPGYCGWNVSEQHQLFSLLPDHFCGIQLSDSALMKPIKSVSGIIGIGRDIQYNSYTCTICDSYNCPYRNRKSGDAATQKA